MQVSSATILQLGRAKKYLCLVSCVMFALTCLPWPPSMGSRRTGEQNISEPSMEHAAALCSRSCGEAARGIPNRTARTLT